MPNQCNECGGPVLGRSQAYGSEKQFREEVDGEPGTYGHSPGLYEFTIDLEREQPFFNAATLTAMFDAEFATKLLGRLGDLVIAVGRFHEDNTPCPTCGGPTFEYEGVRYARRGGKAVAAAARRLYALPAPGNPTLPFLCEAYLYRRLGKDEARTVMARVHSLIRAANVEDVWQYEDVEVEVPA